MKNLKKVSGLLLVAAMMTGCSGNSDVNAVKSAKVLKVGITDYEPMDYLDGNGKWIGFDADLSNAFAEKLGVTCEFVEIDWDSKILELNSKKIDCIWNGMTVSDELANELDFSVSYATNFQAVVCKSENVSQYENAESLKTKTVAVEQGSAGDEVLVDGSFKTKNQVKSQVKALLEVTAGTSDCAVIDFTMAQSVCGKGDYANLTIVDKNKISYNNEIFAAGFRKGSDLTKELNTFFKEKYNDGSLKTLSEKYQVALNEDALKA